MYSTRRFYRSVSLPRGTQSENVAARYRNGVLEITLRKNPEQQGKRVHVTAE
jgi:HSP20 family molecular chaperone IbpA